MAASAEGWNAGAPAAASSAPVNSQTWTASGAQSRKAIPSASSVAPSGVSRPTAIFAPWVENTLRRGADRAAQALSFKMSHRRVSTGSERLDHILGGGLPAGRL